MALEGFTYSLADMEHANSKKSSLNKTIEQSIQDQRKDAQMAEFRKYLDSFDNTGGATEQDMIAYTCFQQSLQTAGGILMNYMQIQNILNVPEEDRPYELDMMVTRLIPREQQNAFNIFEEIIGQGWSKKFDQFIINNGQNTLLFGVDQLAHEIDKSDLSNSKKELAYKFIEVAKDAFCLNGPSKRLIKIIRDSSGIAKIFNNTSRLDRAIDNIDAIIKKLKIYRLVANYIPIFFTCMSISYDWKYKLESLSNYIVIKDNRISKKSKSKKNLSQHSRMFAPGVLLGVILSEYTKKLSSNDYLSMWYIAMLIKLLEIESFAVQYQKAAGPQLVKSANYFFEAIDVMMDRYCLIFPVPEGIKQIPIELQEMDLRVPTKEEWEIMKLPPEEQEKIFKQQELERQQKYDTPKNEENVIELPPPLEISSSKKNDKNKDDYVTIGKDIQITL